MVSVAGEEGVVVGDFLDVPVAGPPPNEIPVGGRLFHFRQAWTFSKWAHSIVTHGLGWKWKCPPPPLRRFYQEPSPLLQAFVEEMRSKGVVERTKSIRFQG